MHKANKSTREIRRALKKILQKNAMPGAPVLINLRAEKWKEDDRAWFSANPFRSFRIRRLYENEVPEEFNLGQTHALVRQLTPGIRDKDYLNDLAKGASLDALPDTDAVCMVLWEKANNGATIISLNTVVHEANLMNVPGGDIQ